MELQHWAGSGSTKARTACTEAAGAAARRWTDRSSVPGLCSPLGVQHSLWQTDPSPDTADPKRAGPGRRSPEEPWPSLGQDGFLEERALEWRCEIQQAGGPQETQGSSRCGTSRCETESDSEDSPCALGLQPGCQEVATGDNRRGVAADVRVYGEGPSQASSSRGLLCDRPRPPGAPGPAGEVTRKNKAEHEEPRRAEGTATGHGKPEPQEAPTPSS